MPEAIPARDRVRGRPRPRGGQAGGHGDPSGGGTIVRHPGGGGAGARADDGRGRRSAPSRHRPPAGQGHVRPHRAREDRRGLRRPHRAARAPQHDEPLRLPRAWSGQGVERRHRQADRARRALAGAHGRGPGGQGQARGDALSRARALPGVTFLECRLETGRTHQIRVHLAFAGASAARRSRPTEADANAIEPGPVPAGSDRVRSTASRCTPPGSASRIPRRESGSSWCPLFPTESRESCLIFVVHLSDDAATAAVATSSRECYDGKYLASRVLTSNSSMSATHGRDPRGRRSAPACGRAAPRRSTSSVAGVSSTTRSGRPRRSERAWSSWSAAMRIDVRAAVKTVARRRASSSRRSASAPGTRCSRRAAPAPTMRAPSWCCPGDMPLLSEARLERPRHTPPRDPGRGDAAHGRDGRSHGIRTRGPRERPARRDRRASRRDDRPSARSARSARARTASTRGSSGPRSSRVTPRNQQGEYYLTDVVALLRAGGAHGRGGDGGRPARRPGRQRPPAARGRWRR